MGAIIVKVVLLLIFISANVSFILLIKCLDKFNKIANILDAHNHILDNISKTIYNDYRKPAKSYPRKNSKSIDKRNHHHPSTGD